MLDFGIQKNGTSNQNDEYTVQCTNPFKTIDEFLTYTGLKQGDGLATILFSIALEYTVQKLGIN